MAAYLVGSVSQGLSPLLSPLPRRAINAFWKHLPAVMRQRLSKRSSAAAKLEQSEFDPIQQYFLEAHRKLPPNREWSATESSLLGRACMRFSLGLRRPASGSKWSYSYRDFAVN